VDVLPHFLRRALVSSSAEQAWWHSDRMTKNILKFTFFLRVYDCSYVDGMPNAYRMCIGHMLSRLRFVARGGMVRKCLQTLSFQFVPRASCICCHFCIVLLLLVVQLFTFGAHSAISGKRFNISGLSDITHENYVCSLPQIHHGALLSGSAGHTW